MLGLKASGSAPPTLSASKAWPLALPRPNREAAPPRLSLWKGRRGEPAASRFPRVLRLYGLAPPRSAAWSSEKIALFGATGNTGAHHAGTGGASRHELGRAGGIAGCTARTIGILGLGPGRLEPACLGVRGPREQNWWPRGQKWGTMRSNLILSPKGSEMAWGGWGTMAIQCSYDRQLVCGWQCGGWLHGKNCTTPGLRHLPAIALSPFALNPHSTPVRWELVSTSLTNERKPSLPE